MGINTLAGKLTAALAGGVILAGVGAGAALAAPAHTGAVAQTQADPTPAPKHPDPNKHYLDLYLQNDTPYAWQLDPTGTSTKPRDNSGWVNGPPQAQVQPGETVTIAKANSPASVTDLWVSYQFTDTDGNHHRAQLHSDQTDVNWIYAQDWDGPNQRWTNNLYGTASTVFHISSVGSVYYPHLRADYRVALNKPADLTIDAKANPHAAADAMTHFTDGTDKKYTPTGKPFQTESDPVQGSAKLINATSGDAELGLGTGVSNAETTSLSLEVTWEASLGFFDLANQSLSASVTGGHTWGFRNTFSEDNAMPVPPGNVGWFIKQNNVDNITGDFDFTYNGNITYHIKNVTVSMPGVGGGSKPATTLTSHYEQVSGDLPTPPAG